MLVRSRAIVTSPSRRLSWSMKIYSIRASKTITSNSRLSLRSSTSSNKMRNRRMKRSIIVKKFRVRFIMIVPLSLRVIESMIYRTIHITCRSLRYTSSTMKQCNKQPMYLMKKYQGSLWKTSWGPKILDWIKCNSRGLMLHRWPIIQNSTIFHNNSQNKPQFIISISR